MKNRNKKAPKPQPGKKKPIQRVGNNNINKWAWFALAVVIIITFAIYFKAIKFNILYSWDDQLYIRENGDVNSLNWTNIKLFFTRFYAGNYHPITMLSYALDHKIGAAQAYIFHLNNILLHLLNTFLVFVLIKKISPKNAVVALITAAFFAVHPMHVESVAWVAERKDVLYTFFFLLSLIMYMEYLKLQKIKHLFLATIFFVLSCFSKSAAVVLPLVMVLLDYYSNRKYTWKTIVEKVPFFLISLIFGIVAIYSQKGSAAIQNMAPKMSTIEHLSIVCFSFVSYILKAFIPVKLSAIYPYPVELGSQLPFIYYLSILGVLLMLSFIWYSRKWGKDIVFGFLFFVITIILVLQLIPVGAATMADRYTYVPYIGVFFMLGKIYERISLIVNAKMNYKQYLLIVFCFGFIAFSTITEGQVKIWENEDVLFSNVISKYPGCRIAYRGRGMYYTFFHANYTKNINKKDDLIKAIADFEKSLEFSLTPKDKKQAYYDLGIAKAAKGDFDGAIQEYNNSIGIDSTYGKPYINRGTCYMDYYVKTLYVNDDINKEIYLKKAIVDFESALKCEIKEDDKLKSYCNLGDAKVRLGNYIEAISDFDKGIQLDSNLAGADAFCTRGFAKFKLEDYVGALNDFNTAIKLNPQDANSIKNRNIVKAILEKENQ